MALFLLLLLSPAHARCAVERVATPGRAVFRVHAQELPLSCTTLVVDAGPDARVRAWHTSPDGRQRLGRDRVRQGHGDAWRVDVPALVVGEQVELDVRSAATVTLTLGAPPSRPPDGATAHTTMEMRLDPRHPEWGFMDAARGRTVVRTEWTFAGEGPFRVPVPEGAENVDGGGLTPVAFGLEAPAGTRAAVTRWELPGADPRAAIELPPGSFTLSSPAVRFVAGASDGVALEVREGVVTATAPAGGTVRWRVDSVAGVPVIPDAATFVAGITTRVAGVSLPEPAVPQALRGERDRDALRRAIVDAVRAMRVAPRPWTPPLQPGPLATAWSRRAGTPLEMALTLHHMLAQEHYRVGWALTGPAPDPSTLDGYDEALVVVEVDGADLWIDPSCAACAEGEVPTRLLDRPALGAREHVPPAPGTLVRTLSLTGDVFSATVRASGAAALWIREIALAAGPSAAPTALAEALGLPGGRVVAAEGLPTKGSPIQLEIRDAAVVRAPFPDSDATPWVGGWRDAAE